MEGYQDGEASATITLGTYEGALRRLISEEGDPAEYREPRQGFDDFDFDYYRDCLIERMREAGIPV